MSKTMLIHSEDRRIYKFLPESIPMELLNEEWAEINHSQSLAKLNSRGGLSVYEILCNIKKVRFSSSHKESVLDADELMRFIYINT